jgi:hypothetical protein
MKSNKQRKTKKKIIKKIHKSGTCHFQISANNVQNYINSTFTDCFPWTRFIWNISFPHLSVTSNVITCDWVQFYLNTRVKFFVGKVSQQRRTPGTCHRSKHKWQQGSLVMNLFQNKNSTVFNNITWTYFQHVRWIWKERLLEVLLKCSIQELQEKLKKTSESTHNSPTEIYE